MTEQQVIEAMAKAGKDAIECVSPTEPEKSRDWMIAMQAALAVAKMAIRDEALEEAADTDMIEQAIDDIINEGGSIRSAADYVAANIRAMKG